MEALEEKRQKKSLAGKKGNEVRWQIAEQSQCDNNAITTQSQIIASKVNESKVNEIKEDDSKIPYLDIIEFLNEETGSHFKPNSAKTRLLIKARWNEGFTIDDFKDVINKKVASWSKNPEMAKYLRPETLFGTKFEGYLNEKFADVTRLDKPEGPVKAW
jgi:uncharacterized phage protein (TIGR02220 family)